MVSAIYFSLNVIDKTYILVLLNNHFILKFHKIFLCTVLFCTSFLLQPLRLGKKFEIQKNESNPKNSYESEPKLVKYLNHFN